MIIITYIAACIHYNSYWKSQSIDELYVCVSLECQQAHNLYRYVQSLQLSSCEGEDDIEGDIFTISCVYYAESIFHFSFPVTILSVFPVTIIIINIQWILHHCFLLLLPFTFLVISCECSIRMLYNIIVNTGSFNQLQK